MSIDTQILLIAFSYNLSGTCEDFLNLVIQTYTKLAKEPEKLEYIIGINSDDINLDKLKLHDDICKIKIVDIRLKGNNNRNFIDLPSKYYNLSNIKNSRCHGDALNELFKYVNVKYFMTLDSDCFCFKKDWDIIMKSMLKDNIIVVGSGHHPSLMRYKEFPAIYSSLYLTDVWKKIKIDFTFGNDKKFDREVRFRDKELFRILKVPYNNKLTSDTGSKLPYLARINGFEGIEFKSFRYKLSSGIKFLNKIKIEATDYIKRTEEFQYDNELFFIHLAHGRRRDINKDSFTVKFLKEIKIYFKETYGIILK